MMRLAAAAVMFLCSIATVSAQEPTGALPTGQLSKDVAPLLFGETQCPVKF